MVAHRLYSTPLTQIVDKRVDALTVPKVGLARYIKAMRTKEAAERRREERWEAARSLRKQAAEAWEAVWKREGAEKKGKKEGEKGEALAMLLGRIDGGKAEAGDREEERGEKRKGGEERRGEAGEQWGEIEREGEGAEGKGEGEKGEKKDGVAKRNHKATVAYVTGEGADWCQLWQCGSEGTVAYVTGEGVDCYRDPSSARCVLLSRGAAAGPIYDGSKRDSRGAAESGGVYAEDFVKTLVTAMRFALWLVIPRNSHFV